MVAAALQHRAPAQRAGVSPPGARGALLASACILSPIGARVAYGSELTSEWTNQWGQASVRYLFTDCGDAASTIGEDTSGIDGCRQQSGVTDSQIGRRRERRPDQALVTGGES